MNIKCIGIRRLSRKAGDRIAPVVIVARMAPGFFGTELVIGAVK